MNSGTDLSSVQMYCSQKRGNYLLRDAPTCYFLQLNCCLLRLMLEEIDRLSKGDFFDQGSILAPLINEQEAITVEDLINKVRAQGAHILSSSRRDGAYLESTLITRVRADVNICREEIFGPVAVIDSFGSWSEALDKVNDSEFGLQASVFSNNNERDPQGL